MTDPPDQPSEADFDAELRGQFEYDLAGLIGAARYPHSPATAQTTIQTMLVQRLLVQAGLGLGDTLTVDGELLSVLVTALGCLGLEIRPIRSR